jgi:hypothetical protein
MNIYRKKSSYISKDPEARAKQLANLKRGKELIKNKRKQLIKEKE